MTQDRKQAALSRLEKQIPAAYRMKFRVDLDKATDECYDGLMTTPIKGTVKTILFSIFLGSFGIDRFYVGDTGLGILRIVTPIIASILSFIPFIGTILCLIIDLIYIIWRFVDIFVTYKKAQEHNWRALQSRIFYISSNPSKSVGAGSASNVKASAAQINKIPAQTANMSQQKAVEQSVNVATAGQWDKDRIDNIIVNYCNRVLEIDTGLKYVKQGDSKVGCYVKLVLYVNSIGRNLACSLGTDYKGEAFATVNLGAVTDADKTNIYLEVFNRYMAVHASIHGDNVLLRCREKYESYESLGTSVNKCLVDMLECFDKAEFTQLALHH